MNKEKCQCGDIRQGSIYRGDPLTGFWLECPVCHKPQFTQDETESLINSIPPKASARG